MTGQEARDDEREALIAAAWVAIGDADRCTALHITPSTGTLHRRLRQVTVALAAAHAELAARKHPEPDITEARIDAAAVAMFEATYGNGDWVHREEIEEKLYRDRARVALEAALRVPVGEGEQ